MQQISSGEECEESVTNNKAVDISDIVIAERMFIRCRTSVEIPVSNAGTKIPHDEKANLVNVENNHTVDECEEGVTIETVINDDSVAMQSLDRPDTVYCEGMSIRSRPSDENQIFNSEIPSPHHEQSKRDFSEVRHSRY